MIVFTWSLASYEIKKGETYSRKLYNHIKEIFGKYFDRKRSLGLGTSDYYLKLTNYVIKEENIKCK